MSTTVSSPYETHTWSAPSAIPKLHSRAREAETACCAEFTFTKSLERIEIPQCIYDSRVGLGLLSKDPIGFGGGDTNLYRMTGNHPNMATDPSGLFDDGLMTLNLNPTRGELEAGRRLELESMIGAIEESNALRATEERARGRSKLLRGLGVPESLEHLYGEVKYEALEFFGWVNAIERENAESASYREYLRRRNDAKAVFIGVSILGGSIETGTGIALSIAGLGSPITVLGVAMTAHGGDGLTATIRSMGSDEPIDTFTSQTFQAAGMPRGYANLADAGVGIGLGLGAGGLLRSARLASPVSTVETLTHRNGIYEVVSQQAITGTSRSAHRASANRSLLESIDNDPVLSRQLGNILGVDDVAAHMRTGRSALRNPPGTEWHHPIDNPGVMQLLRRPVHRHSELQNILHPDNIGGFGTHFGN